MLNAATKPMELDIGDKDVYDSWLAFLIINATEIPISRHIS